MRRAIGILFQTPLVEAIYRDDNPKTQTRRIALAHGDRHELLKYDPLIGLALFKHKSLERPVEAKAKGVHGDLLWVREAWNIGKTYSSGAEPRIIFRAVSPDDRRELVELNRRLGLSGPAAYKWIPRPLVVPLLAKVPKVDEHVFDRWRPGIHLTQWAARLWLNLLQVRVQRLHDIDERDAQAEGVEPIWNGARYSYVDGFRKIWNEINAETPGADWNSNPSVWAYTFKRTSRPK